jgi:glycolate oxidase iron-sulfur subunit
MADARLAPANESAAQLLRRCVQCGLCLPHCATYLATGNEVQSPRGRLVLLEKVLENPGANPAADARSFFEAFDQCIGCRACESACPSGVPFSLLAQGQKAAATWLDRFGPAATPAVPGWVLARMDRPGFLAGLSRLGGGARGLLRILAGKNWRIRLAAGPTRRLARLVGSMPTSHRSDQKLIRQLDGLGGREPTRQSGLAPSGSPSRTVAFFRGCANAGMLAGTSRRFRDLLRAAGCRLVDPSAQACCGALAAHTAGGSDGRPDDLEDANRSAFAGALNQGTTILTEAAGCGLHLKDYGEDFRDLVQDAAVFLAGLDLPPLGEVPLRVAYHDPCHARHGQQITAEPRTLLKAIPGVDLVEPAEPEVCCGSGGIWGLKYPDVSQHLGLRKAAHLAATKADLVVTSNPGCLGQIADALRQTRPDLPILPLTDLLWYAAVRGRRGSSQN